MFPFSKNEEQEANESALNAAAESNVLRTSAPETMTPETLLELADRIMQPESKAFIPALNKDFTTRFINKGEHYALTAYFEFVETIRWYFSRQGYDPLMAPNVAKPIVSKPFIFLNLSASVGGAERRAQTTQTLRFERENQKRSWLK